jgi:CHASE3 domain sensor protein
MAELVRAKMAELQRTIDLRNAGKRDEAVALVQTDEGLNSMAELRRLAELVLADEQRLLRARSETTRQTNIRLLVVSLVGMALLS